MLKVILIASLILVVAGTGWIYTSCRTKTFLTEQEFVQQIEKEIPVGSSLQSVVKFTESFKNKFSVEVGEYIDLNTEIIASLMTKKIPKAAKGVVKAKILRVQVVPIDFSTWHLIATYYFDSEKQLVGYQIEYQYDGF